MVVARRYARALYEEAERTSKTDAVDEDIELIVTSLEDSGELVRFFNSPVISREKKQDVVRALFSTHIDGLTLKFLEMLVQKQREDVFLEIASSYRNLRNEQRGIIEATARTAATFSDEERDHLAASLSRLTGKQVRLQVETDTGLIG
ncbi:MAG: ATP synthase F1 subunit delta, partial [Rhodothermales bacterium]